MRTSRKEESRYRFWENDISFTGGFDYTKTYKLRDSYSMTVQERPLSEDVGSGGHGLPLNHAA